MAWRGGPRGSGGAGGWKKAVVGWGGWGGGEGCFWGGGPTRGAEVGEVEVFLRAVVPDEGVEGERAVPEADLRAVQDAVGVGAGGAEVVLGALDVGDVGAGVDVAGEGAAGVVGGGAVVEDAAVLAV